MPGEARPLGGLLIGGASRRLGQPKQLVTHGGSTLAERAHRALAPWVDEVVLLGAGEVAGALADLPRWPDRTVAGDQAPRGPLAGMLTAFGKRPEGCWIFVPCDLPHIQPPAVEWLISERRPERWAIFPGLPGENDAHPQPLLALYEPPARRLLETLLAAGHHGPSRLASRREVAVVPVPEELIPCWRDIDTREDLAALSGSHPGIDPA
ncbi:MAG: molybdenum cofactor guanylyltransferase [Acidobacteriota bacterium]